MNKNSLANAFVFLANKDFHIVGIDIDIDIGTTTEVLEGLPRHRKKFTECKQLRPVPSLLLWPGQRDHPNARGGSGGESQTLGHLFEITNSGLILGYRDLT